MTIEFEEKLQDRWNSVCRAKGYVPSGGLQTRYTEDGSVYHPLPGFGRVHFDARWGWIAILSTWGIGGEVYQYVKLDEALVAAAGASIETEVSR